MLLCVYSSILKTPHQLCNIIIQGHFGRLLDYLYFGSDCCTGCMWACGGLLIALSSGNWNMLQSCQLAVHWCLMTACHPRRTSQTHPKWLIHDSSKTITNVSNGVVRNGLSFAPDQCCQIWRFTWYTDIWMKGQIDLFVLGSAYVIATEIGKSSNNTFIKLKHQGHHTNTSTRCRGTLIKIRTCLLE